MDQGTRFAFKFVCSLCGEAEWQYDVNREVFLKVPKPTTGYGIVGGRKHTNQAYLYISRGRDHKDLKNCIRHLRWVIRNGI